MLLTASQSRALRRAIALLDIRWARVALAVLLGSLGLGSSVALTSTSAWLIARASQMPPVLALSIAATAVRLFGISRSVLRYLERLQSHGVALAGMASLREQVYRRLADSPVEAIAGLKRGDLLNRTGADVDSVGDAIVRGLMPVLVGAVVSLGTVVFITWLLPASGAILAVCLLFSFTAGPFFAARAARRAELAQIEERAELAATSLTMVEGGSELAVWGCLDVLRGRLAAQEERLTRLRDRAAAPAALAAGMDVLGMALATLGAIVVGIPALADGELSAVALAVVVLTPLAAFEATANLPAAATQLVRSAGAAERIMDLLDSAADGTQRRGSLPADAAPILEARDVAVAWPGGPAVAGGINLTVEPGRAVAIVGQSGVGKTTLLSTLAGLLPPREGDVLLDGHALAEVPRDVAARHATMTSEDAHIFATSVLENLRVARGNVTEEEAVELLGQAGLAEWLSQLPDGVHTLLDSDAVNVSGGERRRLLIARALASPAPLLLVDEPAEHLDPKTAHALMTDLLALAHPRDGTEPRGVVVVTHHLGALAGADEVLLLERNAHGLALVEDRGTHGDLLARSPGYRSAAMEA
ncbi:MAG TPA: thiol reductant ABC exporter subunit CydC [Actinomycetaceae bacterium]|nr:thiol reductant ABC exporter subunit CydC [Actinomycetaceae bacterium]